MVWWKLILVLLTTPPGFEGGMDFSEVVKDENPGELSNKGDHSSGTSTPDIIKLSDILAQSEEFDFTEDDTCRNDTSNTLVCIISDKHLNEEEAVKIAISVYWTKCWHISFTERNIYMSYILNLLFSCSCAEHWKYHACTCRYKNHLSATEETDM